eukprot:TRINITY_DN16295_c0_g1_i17.p1 TRINITY_DN16295_c0_g1~~TRINITY_DN16295_c0_g1_i17.p1  ORF type:complete len:104 (-),score=12.16 TRINITY_DN16295_c0_g1_i17:43-354(-)
MKTVEIMDLPEITITHYFQDCFSFIDTARQQFKGCLVHCNAGVSRSATVCIAYVMARKKMTFQDAYSIVKSVKPDVRPNEGFIVQLKKFEQVIFDLVSEMDNK